MIPDAAAVENEIVARRDRLVARRTELLHLRVEIISELRSLDRELSDCAAAARFFGLAVEFPPDEREEYDRIRMQQREREINAREIARAKVARDVAAQATLLLEQAPARIAQIPANSPPSLTPVSDSPRPTVREVALKMLKGAGSTGMKAETIREYLDHHYGMAVHDKTVGMTLYRLSRDQLVHRVGHTWFAGPSLAGSVENPGADTPGPINEAT